MMLTGERLRDAAEAGEGYGRLHSTKRKMFKYLILKKTCIFNRLREIQEVTVLQYWPSSG